MGLGLMIHGLWLLKKTGECLLYRVYRDSKLTRKDSSLLGGFFTTIDQTARIRTGRVLSKIDTKDTKLTWADFDSFLVVVATDDESEGERVGKEVGKQFAEAFGEALSNWDGNTAIFEAFKEKVDALVKYHEMELVEELNELLDTLCSEDENNSG